MDQYVLEVKLNMLFFDLIDLIQLIKNSEDENLKDYAEVFQEIADNELKPKNHE